MTDSPELRPATPGAQPPQQLSTREWRVRPALFAGKAALAVLFLLVALLNTSDPTRLAVSVLAAVLVAAWAARDAILKVRVAADASGVTVVSGLSRKQLPWADIERIKLDVRNRLGLRSELLEIDTGEHLYLFSQNELGVPVSEVVEDLRRIRTGR
ncbi:PH domain-containing protein [Longispora sp. K20-0274]|uniref:PH domain-containing protein n=1 Tax=Longispora sp. K20-0274 TaxID=3088255 RepID=UPI00399B4271